VSTDIETPGTAASGAPSLREVRIVDSDTHPMPRSPDELLRYIPERWHGSWGGRFGTSASLYWSPSEGRADGREPGVVGGSDPALWERQVLGDAEDDFAILLPLVVPNYVNPEQDADMTAACNSWLADTWLSEYNGHGRYKGTITVSPNNPRAAARAIDEWAGHPHIVGIQVSHAAPAPYGDERFDPIWSAAVRHGLPVVMHLNSAGAPPSPSYAGYPQYYMEYHAVGHPLTYMAHLASLICRGTFDRFPDLRFVFVEGGFGWVGPMIWRLDKAVRRLRAELPHLRRLPSDYLYEHVRFTSQPSEHLGRGPLQLPTLFDLVDAPRILMFASDYPHWDYDHPKRALPRLAKEASERIMFRNACELYGLPLVREERA
jgi:predicted TIM-barrel fold metal-dependent hydrolase